MGKKKQRWSVGDIFVVRQSDSRFTAGQVIDHMMPNVITCGFFDCRFRSVDSLAVDSILSETAIACVSCTREQLDFGIWMIVGHKTPLVDRRACINEQYRAKQWVGAKIYDAAIVEDFLEAFYCLQPWDKYFDPKYFEKMLISPEKKPQRVLLSKGC